MQHSILSNLLRSVVFSLALVGIALAQSTEIETALTEAEQKEQSVVDRYWTLLEKTPRRGTSLDRVYGFYVDTGRLEELMTKCRQAAEAEPENAKRQLLLGLILARRNDEQAATESQRAFEIAQKLDADDAMAPFYLGESFIAQGKLQDAAAALEESLKRSLVSLEKKREAISARDLLTVLQTLGRVYERFGDRDNSAKIWNKLEELFPNDLDILARIAETLEEEGQFDKALLRYKKLIEKSGTDRQTRAQYVLAAADLKIRLGDKQGALDDFEKLLAEISDENWLAQSIRDRIERVFVRQADFAGLVAYYQKRLEKYPGELDTVRRCAVALVRLSRTGDAAKLLSETLEKAPSNIPLRLALIDLLVADQKFDEVDQQYAKIDELEPNHPDHISQWGLAVLENKSLPEPERQAAAANIWNRLVEAKPQDAATAILVADLLNLARNFDEAEKLYKKAVELRPGDPNFLEYLGFFYHRQDRKADAIATLQKMADGERRSTDTLSQLSGIFKSLGYVEESVTAMKDAVKSAPDDFELRMNLADLLGANKNFGDAETEFLAAEKLAKPLSADFARFLQEYTQWLQETGKLEDATEKLVRNQERNAENSWRLAVYHAARRDDMDAVESIEQALEFEPKNTVLLEAAAKIYEQADDANKASTIYQQLADTDSARRVDHLKKLANLQRDLGQIDQAIETARLVMATGSGNAANSRFYADMLLNTGRSQDGIEALRRAVRIDPTDTTTLSVLAEVLFNHQKQDEALEILWRIFERTEDLQSRLGVVSRMSNYYQESQRFDEFVQRLQQTGQAINDAAARRESAYCVAQAYVTVSDFDAARRALETLLLTDTESDSAASSDDTMLLSQLSSVAEQQGDFATAIRYQEMLCDLVQSSQTATQEGERLLSLYQLAGEKDKALNHLMQTLIDRGELYEKLAALDGFLSREDYESARSILNRMDSATPNWEILYRQLMFEFWTENFDAAEKRADEILVLSVPRDEWSAKKKYENEKKQNSLPGATQTGNRRMAFQAYPGYSAWGFTSDGNNYYGGGTSLKEQWQQRNRDILQTIFRDRLQLDRYYYNRGMTVSSEPPKPQFTPESFGDARFAAALWKMRMALQRDLDDEKTTNATPSGDAESADKATEKKELKLAKFQAELARQRALLVSEEDLKQATTEQLEDCLRYEMFLDLWSTTAQQQNAAFPEADYAKILSAATPGSIDGTAQNLRNNIEIALALRGESEVENSVEAFYALQNALTHVLRWETLQKVDMEQAFQKAVENADLANDFSVDELAMLKKFVAQALQEQKEAAEKQVAGNRYSKKEILDWFVKQWKELDRMGGPGEPNNTVRWPVNSYSRLVKILQQEEREEDARKILATVEKLKEKYPTIGLLTMRAELPEIFAGVSDRISDANSKDFSEPFSLSSLLQPLLTPASHRMEVVNGVLVSRPMQAAPVTKMTVDDKPVDVALARRFYNALTLKAQRIDPALDNERYEKLCALLNRIKELALVAEKESAQGHGLDFITSVDQIVNQYIQARSAAISPFAKPRVEEAGVQPVMVTGTSYVITTPDAGLGMALKNPLTAEQVAGILATEKELYRVLDTYFAVMNEMDQMREQTRGKTGSASVTQRRKPTPPSLANYRYCFQNQQPLQGYEIRQLLQNSPNRAVMPGQLSQTLLSLQRTLENLDTGLKDATFADGVEALKPEFASRLNHLLDEKLKQGSEWDQKTITAFREAPAVLSPYGNDTIDIEKTLTDLETEKAETEKKGESPPPNYLLALALLYRSQNKPLEALRCLDAMPLTRSGDVRFREQAALNLFMADVDNQELRVRAEKAVANLRGYQLNGEELKTLRRVYVIFEQKEEADKIFDRLLVTTTDMNTQYGLLQELQNMPGDTEPSKQRAIQFALKVFRSPAVRNAASAGPNDFPQYVRRQCIELLQKYGKMGEVIEQMEAQLKSTPGSLDMMMAMADVYHRANRKDDAKRIALELADKIPDEARKMQSYAGLLRNIGMTKEAGEWMQKSLAKNPQMVLQNFWEYQNTFQSSGQNDKLIELLLKISPQQLAGQSGNFGSYLGRWLGEEKTRELAQKLLRHIWDMEGVNENERRQYRFQLVQGLSWSNEKQLYPLFHEVIFDCIAQPEKPEKEFLTGAVRYSNQNPFHIYSWSSSGETASLAGTFLNLATSAGKLDGLDEEVSAVLEKHAQTKTEERDKTKVCFAKLLLALVYARQDDADKTVEMFTEFQNDLDELRKAPSFAQQWSQQSSVVGLEFAKLNHPQLNRWAIEDLEAALKTNRGGLSEPIILKPLMRLYGKSEDADLREKGKALAFGKLREAFRYLKQMGGTTSNLQIGNHYYSPYELQEQAAQMSKLLIENGYSFDVMLVFREMYDGQKWVEESRSRYNYHLRELDSISGSLGKNATPENFVTNLDILIPDPEAENFDAKTQLPLMLGHYHVAIPQKETPATDVFETSTKGVFEEDGFLKLFDDTVEPMADGDAKPRTGLRLVDALESVFASDKERYKNLIARLEALEKAAPDDQSVRIALICCRLLENDADTVPEMVHALVDWTERVSETKSDALYFGCWEVTRRILETEKSSDKKYTQQVLADCEKLVRFQGKLIGSLLNTAGDDAAGQEMVTALFSDVKRHVPSEWMENVKPDFNAELLASLLLNKSGEVAENLSYRYRAVAKKLVRAIAGGPADTARLFMDFLKKTFKNGWPRVEGAATVNISRANAMQILVIYEAVMQALHRHAAENATDHELIADAILEIVLPSDEKKPPFLGIYSDLGGYDGYFRSPLHDLVDWCVKAKKADELLKRIAEKRQQKFVTPPSETEIALQLDAVEFALALKQKDADKIDILKKAFLDKIKGGDTLAAKYALVTCVPVCNPDNGAILEDFTLLEELIDAAVCFDKTEPCRRYTYHAIRTLYPVFVRKASLADQTRWLTRLRKISGGLNTNGFRFTAENRLYHDGLKALHEEKWEEALAVLRFFSSVPATHYRYRDLSEFLDTLDDKLKDRPEEERKTLLGNLDLSKIARRTTARREPGIATPVPAQNFDLPSLPEGTMVYENDFETSTGMEWSVDRRDVVPSVDQTILGDFFEDRLRFRMENLPEHQFVRIRFDLYILEGIDGLLGKPRDFGVDQWGMSVDNATPIMTSFSNYYKDPNNQKQSFPDDYSPWFGHRPAWYGDVLSENMWGDDLQKGFGYGRRGAAMSNKFGYGKDTLYAIDVIMPHRDSKLAVNFFTFFQDGPFGLGILSQSEGEAWGLDNFRVDVIAEPLKLTDGELQKCFDALVGDDASKAHAARWRLVAAENTAVEYIARRLESLPDEPKKTLLNPSSFDRFRIERVLQLIGTPEAKMLHATLELSQ